MKILPFCIGAVICGALMCVIAPTKFMYCWTAVNGLYCLAYGIMAISKLKKVK